MPVVVKSNCLKTTMTKALLILMFGSPLLLTAQTNVVVWSDAITVTQTNAYITSPRVALLTDGSPLVSWGVSSDSQQIFIAHFEDPGFSGPVEAVKAPNLFGFGGYDMAVWNDHVFVVFEKLGGGIFLSVSTYGGQQFSAPIGTQFPLPGMYSGLSAVIFHLDCVDQTLGQVLYHHGILTDNTLAE